MRRKRTINIVSFFVFFKRISVYLAGREQVFGGQTERQPDSGQDGKPQSAGRPDTRSKWSDTALRNASRPAAITARFFARVRPV